MERLTKVDGQGRLLSYSISDTGLPTLITSGNPYRKLIEKLKSYEDAGLGPEEIPVLLDRLERATEQWNIWCDAYQKDISVWIPVVDRLPKAKEDVLICTKSGWILIGWYGPNGQRWHITPADAGITREDIVSWMPLPEPFNLQN